MSDREKAIQILKEMPTNVSIQEILEALNLIFEINNRIENIDIDETITTEELLEEMKEW